MKQLTDKVIERLKCREFDCKEVESKRAMIAAAVEIAYAELTVGKEGPQVPKSKRFCFCRKIVTWLGCGAYVRMA